MRKYGSYEDIMKAIGLENDEVANIETVDATISDTITKNEEAIAEGGDSAAIVDSEVVEIVSDPDATDVEIAVAAEECMKYLEMANLATTLSPRFAVSEEAIIEASDKEVSDIMKEKEKKVHGWAVLGMKALKNMIFSKKGKAEKVLKKYEDNGITNQQATVKTWDIGGKSLKDFIAAGVKHIETITKTMESFEKDVKGIIDSKPSTPEERTAANRKIRELCNEFNKYTRDKADEISVHGDHTKLFSAIVLRRAELPISVVGEAQLVANAKQLATGKSNLNDVFQYFAEVQKNMNREFLGKTYFEETSNWGGRGIKYMLNNAFMAGIYHKMRTINVISQTVDKIEGDYLTLLSKAV